MIIFKPYGFTVYDSTIWVILGAIAVVGSVPVGYLIHQGYLLWNFLNGRTEHFKHVSDLGTIIQDKTINKISVKLDDEEFNVDRKELNEKIQQLGKEYVKQTHVCFNRDIIMKNGYLTPLHDLIFQNSKTHDRYYRGAWTYSRITKAFLGSVLLAAIPWFGASLYYYIFSLNFSVHVPEYLIIAEFLILMVISYFVSEWSRREVDINEQLLTWLYEQKLRQNKENNDASSPIISKP